MNDALYEQLVTRKSRPMDLVIRILCIAALVVVLCGGMLFIGSLAVHKVFQQCWYPKR